ncbi:MAG: SDR family NAD(P)-dependent oxidoreductase [Pseudomonadota bacterium]
MTKTILVTGATDGIGLLTAQLLAEQGHTVLLHGRSQDKLERAQASLGGSCQIYKADLSSLSETRKLAEAIRAEHSVLDVLINNAGVFKTPNPKLPSGQDVRFVVNTVAPYVLTQALLPILQPEGRVINLSSAAQAPVNLGAMRGEVSVADMDAYAMSKLAITIWSQEMAKQWADGPVVIAVNPGSLLASKMVKEGFGVAGHDLHIGADILCKLALDPAHGQDSGKYWDNDAGRFAPPQSAASDPAHVAKVMDALEHLAQPA